jgi:uncharacterized membrane protein
LNSLYAFLHDIGFATYIGGAIAMEFVLGPAQAAIPPAQAQVMGQKTADRFLWLVWGSLGLIIATGALRLNRTHELNFSWPFVHGRVDLSYGFGQTLLVMFVIWCLLVINGLLITFVLRPKLTGRLRSGTTAASVSASQNQKLQAAQWIQRLTRADLVLALVAAVLGASLKYGGLIDL